MTKKRKFFTILLVVISMLVLAKIFFFYAGSASGIVVDANTGQPIEGAIVSVKNGKGWPIVPWGYNIEKVTDKSGKYYFYPIIGIKNYLIYFTGHGGVRLGISCLVYKDGYAAYSTDEFDPSSARSFIGDDEQFKQKNNVVKLYHLPSDDPKFHDDNASWFGGHGALWPLIEKALESECKKANTKTKRK